jgi:hypothetical protein
MRAAAPDFDASDLSARLEAARGVIETKFLNAGEMLSQAVEGIGALLATMDSLTQALSPETSAATTRQLADTAARLSALPARQAARRGIIGALAGHRTGLGASVEDMRRSLAYMRAFTVSIRIAAGGITQADQEFDVFAQEMSARVEAGRAEVDGLEASLFALQRELDEAADQAGPLEQRCAAMIPAVPDQLLASAAIMGQHNRQITAATADSIALARDTHRKVGRMLAALQIGDITRQRIEHVQGGLGLLANLDPALPPAAQARIRTLVLSLLAAELGATLDDFNREVAQLGLGLAGLARDASALLSLRDLVYGGDKAQADKAQAGKPQAGGFLQELEHRIGDAVTLVTEIETADGLTRETSGRVAETARILSGRLGAVQSIKTDVLFMALNTSLKSSRLGEAGRPLATIAVELRSQAGQLERIATICAGRLRQLTEAAVSLAGDGGEETEAAGVGAGAALLAATAHIHEAGAATERDIAALGVQGQTVLALITQSSERLDLQNDIGAALAEVLQDLPEGPADPALCTGDVAAPLGAILGKVRASYTMAQERVLHDAVTAEWGLDAPAAPPAEPEASDALEDVLF